MLHLLARLFQLAGLIIVPFAVMGNISNPERVTLGTSLQWSAVGVGLFFLGWLLQKGMGKKE